VNKRSLDLLLWPQLVAMATLLLPAVHSSWVETSITPKPTRLTTQTWDTVFTQP